MAQASPLCSGGPAAPQTSPGRRTRSCQHRARLLPLHHLRGARWPLPCSPSARGSPGAGWRTPGQAGLGSEGPHVRSDSACRITLGLPRASGRACWGDGHPPAQCERARATPRGLGFPVCEGTGPSCAGPGLAWASPRESQGARGGRNQRPGQEVNPEPQEPGGGLHLFLLWCLGPQRPHL